MKPVKADSTESPVGNLVGSILIQFLAWILKMANDRSCVESLVGSLLLGYATILGIIACGIVMPCKVVRISRENKMASPRQMIGLRGIGVLVALFFLAFSSFHFGAFHAGHATFLHEFFPLTKVELSSSAFA